MSEFPVNLFGGKGHNDVVGIARSIRLKSVRGIDPESNMSDWTKLPTMRGFNRSSTSFERLEWYKKGTARVYNFQSLRYIAYV